MMNEIDLAHVLGGFADAERILARIKRNMLSDKKQAQAIEEQALMRAIDKIIANITNSRNEAAR